jgi:hypothetical protein
MKRTFAGAILASFVALAAGACDDNSGVDTSTGFAGSSGGYGGYGNCSYYTTCGTCTPVSGCGWCFNASGGTCTTDPDQCASMTEFTWTWEPSGCPNVEAGVVPVDAGTGTPTGNDAGHPAPTSDAGSGTATDAGTGTTADVWNGPATD